MNDWLIEFLSHRGLVIICLVKHHGINPKPEIFYLF